jgi:tetratricopeptide (TPR) repeat protein
MAFEKAKVLKAAEKFLSQGKINAAIKEYRQIVDHDANDFTTLNMLGDLYARANKKEEAVSCFERIAQHYSTQEFNLKAIAMYKKIERLRPRDPEVARRLGDLYASQGLVVDARAQYLVVADAHTRTGDNKRALEILHRIADLDPNNTEIRLKLAEGYVKENMRREASNAFVQAAERLHQIGSQDKALDAYSRALALAPDDRVILQGLLETHIARGTADEAAEILDGVVERNQDDAILVSMLARAYLEAEDPKGAERATTILMTQDASNYPQFIPVARLYLKTDDGDDTVRILGNIIERMLAGREEKELLELVNQVLERNPDHVGALRMLVRIYWWQRDMDSLRAALERLADSAEAAQLPDEERYALTQLVRLAPDEQRYMDRLTLLGGLQEESADDFTPAPVANEVPQFETFATEPAALAEEPQTVSFEPAPTPTFTDPSASFADLSEDATETTAEFQMVDFGEVTPAEIGTESPGSAPIEEQRLNAMMRQELESVDFYIAQGYNDIAIDTLDMLERQFGAHADILSRRQKLTPRATAEAPAVFEFGGVEELTAEKPGEPVAIESDYSFASLADDGKEPAPTPTTVAPPSKDVGHGIDAGLAELFEEFRVAEEEEIPEADFETHYNMGTAYKEMDLIDEAIQEFQISAGLVKPSDGTSRYLQCCNMLGHCFMRKEMPDAAIMWFKKGLAAPGHSEDEYQALRYELAAAYEQQGQLDEAHQLYTEIYGIDVSYREVGEKLRKLGKKKEGKRLTQ